MMKTKFWTKFFLIVVFVISISFLLIFKNKKVNKKYFYDKFKLNFQYSIGQAEGDINSTFSFMGGIQFDNKGNIYILDTGDYQIKVYDRKGHFIKNFGRKGQGPGEMETPVGIQHTDSEELFLFDNSLARVSIFDYNGSFKTSFVIPSLSTDDFHDALVDNNSIYIHSYTYSRTGKLIHKYDHNGKYILSFADEIVPKTNRIRPHLNSGKLSFTPDKKIILVLPYPYTIFIFYNYGKLLKKIEKKFPYVKPPYIHPNGILQTMFTISDVSIWRDYIFILVWITDKPSLDDSEKSTPYLDIFSLDGHFIDHLKIENPASGAGILDNSYYILEFEPYPRVAAYQIKGIKK